MVVVVMSAPRKFCRAMAIMQQLLHRHGHHRYYPQWQQRRKMLPLLRRRHLFWAREETQNQPQQLFSLSMMLILRPKMVLLLARYRCQFVLRTLRKRTSI